MNQYLLGQSTPKENYLFIMIKLAKLELQSILKTESTL